MAKRIAIGPPATTDASVNPDDDRRAALSRGRRHPLYRAIRAAWWVLAIWLSAAVLIGVIRGTFV